VGDPAESSLAAGRAALLRAAWAEARTHFEAALGQRESVDALEGLGVAARWQMDGAAALPAHERAYRLARGAGDDAAAARLAIELTFDAGQFRGAAEANGWLERAVDLLERLPTCPEHAVSAYLRGNRALNDVSALAAPGRVTAIIGPNGSGKTTLLNMVCGFYRTDSGSITLDGEALDSSSPSQVARAGVARTFQTPNIPEGISVLDAVVAGRYISSRTSILSAVLRLPSYRRTRREDQIEAARVLDLVGLTELRDAEAVSLPLGQRRMLEVARSLIARPGVLLLDEVASGLDEHEVDRLSEVIRKVAAAGGTVVLVEHNFQLVLSLADEIYALAHGQVMAHGTPAEIESNERVRSEYLGVDPDDVAARNPEVK